MQNNLIVKTLELLELGIREPFEFDGKKLFVDEEGDVYAITGTHDDGTCKTVLSDFALQDLLNTPEKIVKLPEEDKNDDDSIILKATREGENGCNLVINGSTNEIVQVIVSVINGCIEGVIEKNPESPRSRVAADIMAKITLGLLIKD